MCMCMSVRVSSGLEEGGTTGANPMCDVHKKDPNPSQNQRICHIGFLLVSLYYTHPCQQAFKLA